MIIITGKNAYNSIEILNIVNIIEKNMDSMYLHIVSYFLNHDLNNLKNQKGFFPRGFALNLKIIPHHVHDGGEL